MNKAAPSGFSANRAQSLSGMSEKQRPTCSFELSRDAMSQAAWC
ncbi:Uncharacterised protein [Serratia proteamaculans]|nr:Uncharacterised protein [Serratia proteamaculans]